MHPERPLIHFCLDRDADQRSLHTYFELGVRIGRPFAIHRTPGTIPSDAVAVIAQSQAANLKAPVLRVQENAASGDLISRLKSLDRDPDLFGLANALLNFEHEDPAACDYMGRKPPGANALVAADVAEVPWLEKIADEIWQRLLRKGCLDLPRLTPWPTGQLTLCMTHDVDGPELFSPFATARAAYLGLLRGDRFERESLLMSLLFRREGLADPYFNFDSWREFEAIYNGRSTFFVYPGVLKACTKHPRDPKYDASAGKLADALTRVAKSGWEIGVHYPINARNTPSYAESRHRLEQAFASKVRGGRGHYWSMNWSNPYLSWEAMADAGYDYDMTLSPMTLGFRGGSIFPLSPLLRSRDNRRTSFMAAPTAIMDAYAMPRETGRKIVEINQTLGNLITESRDRGAVLTLDWHERTFVNRGAWTGYLRPLMQIISTAKLAGPIRMISGDELYEGWQAYVGKIYGGIY